MSQKSQQLGGLALLAEAFRSKRTGQLVLGEEADAIRVRLEAGHVVALGPAPVERTTIASLPKPNDSVKLRLERVLLEIGVRKAQAADVAPAGAPVPAVPPSRGTLREQVIERLADESLPARFEEGDDPAPDLVPVAVATEPLILEAVRQMGVEEAVRAALGDLDRLLVATPALADERTLTLTEGYLLSRIDGLLSGRQVLQLVPLDPHETERALLGLALTGRVEWRPAPAPAAQPAAAAVGATREASPVAEPEPRAEPEAESVAESVAEPMAVEWPEDALPVAEPADDSPFAPEGAPAESVREDEPVVEAIPDDEPAAEPELATASAPAAAKAPPDPATMSRRREILEFFQSLPLKNHFEVLGVEPGCGDDEVRQAHRTLIKRFHPDAQRDRRLEDLHDVLEAITIRLGEAWEVIGEAKSRAQYESRNNIVRRSSTKPQAGGPAAAAPPAGAPTPPPPPAPSYPEPDEYVSPEDVLHRARRMLSQARYWDVIQMLEMALPGMEPRSQQHRGRLLLARAYSKNPNWLRRAEEMLQELLREDPTSADVHYELGLLYKTGGFHARAQGMFRRALELRPGHKEAAAQLGIPAEPEAGGATAIFKRLFKRGKAS